MDENPGAALMQYELQLGQVEAALLTEPNNAELVELKKSLREVIDLTIEMVALEKADGQDAAALVSYPWRPGQACDAVSPVTSEYEHATLREIDADNIHCVVRFAGRTATTLLKTIRPPHTLSSKKSTSHSTAVDTHSFHDAVSVKVTTAVDDAGDKSLRAPNTNRKNLNPAGPWDVKLKDARDEVAKRREYLKKKREKKQERFEKIEKACEQQKNQWQQFKKKTIDKGKKGVTKRSIFSSESSSGRLGVNVGGITNNTRPTNPQPTKPAVNIHRTAPSAKGSR